MTASALGTLLRKARKERGLSQNELARLAGINQSNLSKIERGSRSASERDLASMAEHLGLPVQELRARAEADRLAKKYGEEEARRIGRILAKEEAPPLPEDRSLSQDAGQAPKTG